MTRDLCFRPGDASTLLTFGESMVSLRSAGPLSAGGCLGMHVAGAESNVAVGRRPARPPRRLGRRSSAPTRTASSSCGSCASEGIAVQHRDGRRPQHRGDVPRAAHRRRHPGLLLPRRFRRVHPRPGRRRRCLRRRRPGPAPHRDHRRPQPGGRGGPWSTRPRAPPAKGWTSPSTSTTAASSGPGTRPAPSLTPLARHASIVIASDDELGLVASGGAGPVTDPRAGRRRRNGHGRRTPGPRRARGRGQARRRRRRRPHRRRPVGTARRARHQHRHRRRRGRLHRRLPLRPARRRATSPAACSAAPSRAPSPSAPPGTGKACPAGPSSPCSGPRPAEPPSAKTAPAPPRTAPPPHRTDRPTASRPKACRENHCR